MKAPRVLLAVLPLLAAAGCQVHEQHHFKSSMTAPQSVTLVDLGSGEQIWAYEIPVGQQLNMLFMRSARSAERDGWDEMRWSISGMGDDNGGHMSTVRVPPPSQRRIETDVRKGPEPRAAAAILPPPAQPVTATPAPSAPAPTTPKPRKTPTGIALPDPKQPAPR